MHSLAIARARGVRPIWRPWVSTQHRNNNFCLNCLNPCCYPPSRNDHSRTLLGRARFLKTQPDGESGYGESASQGNKNHLRRWGPLISQLRHSHPLSTKPISVLLWLCGYAVCVLVPLKQAYKMDAARISFVQGFDIRILKSAKVFDPFKRSVVRSNSLCHRPG